MIRVQCVCSGEFLCNYQLGGLQLCHPSSLLSCAHLERTLLSPPLPQMHALKVETGRECVRIHQVLLPFCSALKFVFAALNQALEYLHQCNSTHVDVITPSWR